MDFLPVIIHSLSLAIKKSIIVPPTPSGRSGFWQRKTEQQSPGGAGNQWLPRARIIDFPFCQQSRFARAATSLPYPSRAHAPSSRLSSLTYGAASYAISAEQKWKEGVSAETPISQESL